MFNFSFSFQSCCEGRFSNIRSLSLPFPTILVRFGWRSLNRSVRRRLVSGECRRFLKIKCKSIPFTLSVFDIFGACEPKFELFGESISFCGETVWIECSRLFCLRTCVLRSDWSEIFTGGGRRMCCVILPFVRLNSNRPFI